MRPFKSAGDDRGFDPNFSAEQSRATLRIDFARREVRVQASPSCDHPNTSKCHDAADIQKNDHPDQKLINSVLHDGEAGGPDIDLSLVLHKAVRQ